MRFLLLALVLAASSAGVQAQQASPAPTTTTPTGAATLSPPALQQTTAPTAAPAAPPAKGEGEYLEPAELKALLHKLWLAEFRINDLLTEVHPEKWKMSEQARNSFNGTLENLRKTLASQEGWRSQFENRPESIYLGYETFIAIIAALPRLDGVGRAVSQFENHSLGAQYSQAGNQLFDLQQALQPYLEYLLRNQDQLLTAAQGNLASCQDQLGFAMRGRMGPAKSIKNYIPEIKGRGRVFYTGEKYPGGDTPHRAAKPDGKKSGENPKAKPLEAGKAKAAAPPEKPKN